MSWISHWLLVTLLFAASGPTAARPLHPSYSFPAAEAIISGKNTQYVVRFDGWVDHAASQLEITARGNVVQSLVPSRDSEPDVLTASAPLLQPGRYELRWRAKSVPDGDFSVGQITFTIGQ